MEQALQVIFSAAFIASVLRVSTPLILPALGGLISELGGVINIALEGIMLVAACTGVLVSVWTGSAWVGALAGLLLGTLVALALAFFHLNLKADLILAAIALNLLASGGTIFVVYLVTRDKSSTSRLVSGQMPFLSDFVPGLRELGDIGRILDQNVLTYAAFLLTAVVALFLYRTRTGIHLRAVGENPDAARSVGIDVRKMQYLALTLSGLLAALGGIYLSMGYVKFFARDMTGGRGFIALAAIYLGARKPFGVLIAALVFGAAEALAIQLGNLRVPTQLVQTIPYVATVVALVVYALAQRQRAIARQRQFLAKRTKASA
ncbi:MAG: ABC transporter permease [Thermoflexales bacterium]|nr:ABC transporter permease [Thermoflexales bacterium]